MSPIKRLLVSAFLAAACLFTSSASADPSFPTRVRGQRVYDYAGMIPDDVEARLQQEVLDYEQATTTQIAIVTVTSLQGHEVMDFTQRFMRAWGVGRRDVNNGVMILYAPTEGANGKMAIGVGYGLEGELPDGECNNIRRNVNHPLWAAGNRAGAVVAVFHAVRDKLGMTQFAQRPGAHVSRPAPESESEVSGWTVFFVILLVLFLIWVLVKLMRNSNSYSSGGCSSYDSGPSFFSGFSSGGSDSSSSGSDFGGGDSGGGGDGGDC